VTVHFAFENTYSRLPERFFASVQPASVPAPRLVRLNRALAEELGLDANLLSAPQGVAVLAGQSLPREAEPIAMAYAGHQFGHFVPQLGDGRAILLGEVIDRNGIRRDIQLKGAGRTPFSRSGDGRAALGPVLREYIVSEAMAALGIPTTRSLAAVTTGDVVVREEVLPGAILTRIASSHIRVGTFQFFAARGDTEGVRLLADHVITRHYPNAAEHEHRYRALVDLVIERQAALIAQWLLVGFIHGVMNTDNMSIAGETIDYGPCAFLDTYHPATVFSSIDHQGRYAYANQPRIAVWNLARFAETLLPFLAEDQNKAVAHAEEALGRFEPRFEAALQAGMRKKLGLFIERVEDVQLGKDLLTAMAEGQADFTLTFRSLADAAADASGDAEVRRLFGTPSAYDSWAARWRERLRQEAHHAELRQAAMRSVNPRFIPRNHRIEGVIEAAIQREDFAPFEELVTVLARPFEDQPGLDRYATPPQPHERVLRTFCGT
jgi:uncharacterized protein YdiU (UPF0061 family)